MSTIKVNKIENTSTTAGGIEVDTSGHVKIDGQQLPTDGPLSNRNIIVNGGMRVAQRGSSFATAVSGVHFVADRWRYEASNSAVISISQETDAPPGFTNSIKAEVTTADTSTTATDFTQFLYKVEANDISHLEYGTANAKTCTISFWAKHKLPGTYPFSLQNHNGTRVYPASYTIQDADTWEYFSITFAGDTGGTWVTDGNGLGMRFVFCWNMGSNFTSGTAGAWAATTSYLNLAPTTGPDVNGTVGNTVQWAGVQLEVGSKSTPFEHRSYGYEFERCQRYYETGSIKFYHGSLSNGTLALGGQFKVTKRASPTMTYAAATGRNYMPTLTEWSDGESFAAQRSGTQEIACIFKASAEL